MIESLSISNYALIDEIHLDFSQGFNIVTGETGAGKSIMLGALSMLFGNRADTRVVTNKEKKSVVEATFDIAGYPALTPLLHNADIDIDDNHKLILRREINPAGRSRSFVNDTPVQLSVLREIAIHLVDIHSQHQNLLLATPEYQLGIIDTLLPDKSVKEAYTAAYELYRVAMRKYLIAKRALQTSRDDEEYLRHQYNRLNELMLQPGEQEQLESEQALLSNSAQIKQSLRNVVALFSDNEDNICDMLNRAGDEMLSVDELPDAESLAERIESLRIEAEDIADTISRIDDRLETDPRRLEAIEERLNDIYDLERKFDLYTVDELIEKREELHEKLLAIDNGDSRVRELAKVARATKMETIKAAEQLTNARKTVAEQFARTLQENAIPLGMKNLQVDIAFNPDELRPSGADAVEFRFAFNKNQPLMPVKDTASGGEISRLMLVIKAIVGEKMQLPTIIFDEIDTGVSGDIAARMGRLMNDIARRIQVIAITHLPPVAAKGSTHFKVYKEDNESRTTTRVRRLTPDERIDELALMLSGDPANPSARQTAADLMNSSDINN